MKKLLLSASLVMVAATAFAATDGKTYETKKGLTIENIWTLDRFHDDAAYSASTIADKAARTAATDGKIVYVGKSGEEQATLEKFDLKTGAYLGALKLTKDGEVWVGTLAANQVGFDDFGHLYIAPYSANSAAEFPYAVYLVDPETGALTKVGGDMDFMGTFGRVDYCDVKGDLTGKEMGATVIAAASSNKAYIFAWTLPQDAEEWEGSFSGDCACEVTGTYPADQELFNYGSFAKHVKDGTDELGMFYVDGFTTFPALYGSDGAMIDNLGNAPEEVERPNSAGTNGIAELTCGAQNIIGFSEGQYPTAGNAQVIITAVNDEYAFSSMEQLWKVPADGFATTSDGGTRVHSIQGIALPEDENGKNATLLVTFKCYNGLAVYRIAEEGYKAQGGVAENTIANTVITLNGDVITVSEAANIEVYNIAGQKVAQANNATQVAAPAAGAYIVKATVNGAAAVKKVIVK